MPRYFFHIEDGFDFVRDEEGQELVDERAARQQAIRGIRSIISEEVLKGRVDLTGRLDIAAPEDQVLFSIHFDEAVQLQVRGQSSK